MINVTFIFGLCIFHHYRYKRLNVILSVLEVYTYTDLYCEYIDLKYFKCYKSLSTNNSTDYVIICI